MTIDPRHWASRSPHAMRAGVVFAATALAWVCWIVRPASAAAGAAAFSPPLAPMQVLRAFAPPAQPWLAGNRGVDLAAHVGEPVYAPAAGTVLYAGVLAGRGVVSIVHATMRTTYEPVVPAVRAGQAVSRGDVIGHVASTIDACGPPGRCLHWGAIRDGDYVDPMALLATAQVRLLPIWGPNGPTGAPAHRSGPPLVLPSEATPEAPTTAPGATPRGNSGAASGIGWTATAGAAGGVMLAVAMRRRRGPPR